MMNSSKVTAFGGATYQGEEAVSNQTVDEFLLAALGPQQMDNRALLLLVTIFYAVVFVTGLVGNLSVCLVITRSRSLHSAMNYYLVSLAVADLTIILLGLPNELSIFWHQYPDTFGEEFCRLRSFLSEAASYANVLTIVSFSLERYLAICRPLYVFPLSDLRRAVIVSSLCWTVAMLASIPHLLFTKINFIAFPYPDGPPAPESAFCAMLDIPEWYPVHEISFIVFFLLPVLLLAFLYVSMVVVVKTATKASIRKSIQRGSEGPPKDNRKQIIRMLVSVVVLFFVSWAPFHFQRLGYVYFREHEYFRTVNQYLFYLSGCFYFLSSTLNPVLYNLMSAKYREAFKRALLCQPPNSPSRPTDNTCAATNLLNSSYMGVQLKGFLDSRRTSRASTDRRSPRHEERGRSSSLEPSSCHLGTTTNPPRRSLCRQKSQSTEGRRGGLLAPPPRYTWDGMGTMAPPIYASTRV